ncbi:hypothetical protein DICVIV_04103 [Dictyocaulus viviparus]|uniref:Uncharacterized protein n=1 Tax=Dictyocaulus viviparus TaxID=29172 RepID=A0A0D8XYQ5_DICVI|nr:hypothetical protein DICVIV_04103 [Dictyocaulus viviparus]
MKLLDVKLFSRMSLTNRGESSGNRRWKVRRSRWLKVRNRLLYYRPHARVFPWYCETCTLSSRFLSVIQNHSCPNKNLSRHVQDFANEQRIALLGFRSKAKDALAVMERVYNPQAIDLNKVNFPLEVPGSDSTIINVVPSLSEICLAVITPKSTHKKSLKKLLPRAHFHVQPVSRRIRPSKNTGQLCTVCHQLFPVFLDYEDHLLNGQCANDIPPDPVPIHMSDPGNIPWKYEIPTVPQIKESSGLMICSLCHDDRFSSTELFHEHIIDCGRKLAAFL